MALQLLSIIGLRLKIQVKMSAYGDLDLNYGVWIDYYSHTNIRTIIYKIVATEYVTAFIGDNYHDLA